MYIACQNHITQVVIFAGVAGIAFHASTLDTSLVSFSRVYGTQYPQPLQDEHLRVYFKFNGITASPPVAFIPQTNDPINATGRLVWNFTDFLTMVNQTILGALF